MQGVTNHCAQEVQHCNLLILCAHVLELSVRGQCNHLDFAFKSCGGHQMPGSVMLILVRELNQFAVGGLSCVWGTSCSLFLSLIFMSLRSKPESDVCNLSIKSENGLKIVKQPSILQAIVLQV